MGSGYSVKPRRAPDRWWAVWSHAIRRSGVALESRPYGLPCSVPCSGFKELAGVGLLFRLADIWNMARHHGTRKKLVDLFCRNRCRSAMGANLQG